MKSAAAGDGWEGQSIAREHPWTSAFLKGKQVNHLELVVSHRPSSYFGIPGQRCQMSYSFVETRPTLIWTRASIWVSQPPFTSHHPYPHVAECCRGKPLWLRLERQQVRWTDFERSEELQMERVREIVDPWLQKGCWERPRISWLFDLYVWWEVCYCDEHLGASNSGFNAGDPFISQLTNLCTVIQYMSFFS